MVHKLQSRTATLPPPPMPRVANCAPLVESKISDREELRKLLTNGLTKRGGAVSLLINALRSPDSVVREWATTALGKISDASVVPALIGVLKNDENWLVRSIATKSLGEIKDTRATLPLIYVVQNKNEHFFVRWMALHALAEIKDSRAVSVLIEALKDNDPTIRNLAAFALGSIGDGSAVPVLLEMLRDPNNSISAIQALGEIKDVRAIPELINALKTPVARASAVKALIQIGLPSAPPLIGMLKETDLDLRKGATDALEAIGVPAVLVLIDALRDSDKNVRKGAAEALRKIAKANPDGFGQEIIELVNGRLGDELRATDRRTTEAFDTLERLMCECGEMKDAA